MKKIKELLKTLFNNNRNDYLILNIMYYLAKNYMLSKSILNITLEDLEAVYDNLEINAQILTGDNITEYDPAFHNLKKSQIEAIKEYKKIMLLDYYKIGEYWAIPCKIYLDFINDRFIF